MFYTAPIRNVWYDIFSVKLDGTDGRWRGRVLLDQSYGIPMRPNDYTNRLIARFIGYHHESLSYVIRAYDGLVEIWNDVTHQPEHRLRYSANQASEEELALVLEKSCPECGTMARSGTFIRTAIVCPKHPHRLLGGF